MMRTILLAACLLAAAPASAAGMFGESAGGESDPATRSYIRIEVLSTGIDYPTVFTTRVAKACWRFRDFGAGLTLYEDYLSWNDNPGREAYLALNADYVILRHVARTGLFYSTPVEVCVQAAGSFLNSPFARVNACLNVGYWGVGLGVEGGVVYYRYASDIGVSVSPYGALYVRLLTFDIGL